jgi:hypothetical protein
MKNLSIFLLLLTAIFTSSCEEVINLDLDTAPPKLVITASINWKKGTAGNQQKITLSTTTGFFSQEIPKVSQAVIFITNSANNTFNFVESSVKGDYVCNNFIPVINETYTLTVISKGATYTATENLKAVAPITEIIQNNQGGFTGDRKEIKTFYIDPASQTNFYLYKYTYSSQVKANYYVDEDVFFDGNKFFSISQEDELKKGDKVEVAHAGISKSYYNYMSVLVSIAGNSGGGPFQSPPATVRGNIINTTKFDDFPLGYFSLSETDTRNYTIE